MTALCLIPIIVLYAAGNIPAARAAYKCVPRLPSALLLICAPVGTAAGLIFAAIRLNRERTQIYRAAIKNPCDENADALIAYLRRCGCVKKPDAWRQLTGVWYACNRSPRISAEKKQELRTILTLKALYLDAPH